MKTLLNLSLIVYINKRACSLVCKFVIGIRVKSHDTARLDNNNVDANVQPSV